MRTHETCGRNRRCARNGFTLIELLVVIAIIAVLIGLLRLPCTKCVKRPTGFVVSKQSQTNRPGPAQLRIDPQRRVPGRRTTTLFRRPVASHPYRLAPLRRTGTRSLQSVIATAQSQSTAIQSTDSDIRLPRRFYNVIAVVDGGGPPPAPFTYRFPVTYGFNYGTWFLYDWAGHKGGDGAFAINNRL